MTEEERTKMWAEIWGMAIEASKHGDPLADAVYLAMCQDHSLPRVSYWMDDPRLGKHIFYNQID